MAKFCVLSTVKQTNQKGKKRISLGRKRLQLWLKLNLMKFDLDEEDFSGSLELVGPVKAKQKTISARKAI